MADAFDLAKLTIPDEPHEWQRKVVDLSGKPQPVGVRVQLNSGVIVRCDVRYDGTNPHDGDRLFTVIAEIDWENYHPVVLYVEEICNDVELRFRVPGMPDDVAQKLAEGLDFRPEKIVRVK